MAGGIADRSVKDRGSGWRRTARKKSAAALRPTLFPIQGSAPTSPAISKSRFGVFLY